LARVGLAESSYSRKGAVALFDHILGILIEEAPTVSVVYGTRVSQVSPFYSASFPKDYNTIPSVTMSIVSSVQKEVGIGQVADGPTYGDALGVHNVTTIEIEIWARNRLELEAVYDVVVRTIRKNRRTLYDRGIIDIKMFRVHDFAFDPNAPRIWWGASQVPGEIWIKNIEFVVEWLDVWSPNVEDGVGEIKKIEVYAEQDDSTQSFTMGLEILGLLDSMYLTRFVGSRIDVLARYQKWSPK